MTVLTIHPEDRPEEADIIRDPGAIAERLWDFGVLFERWTTEHPFTPDATQEEVIAAYQRSVNRLINRYEFHTADVVSLQPDHPDKVALREKFLSEHTHTEFEVRFFVEGRGLFYLHVGEQLLLVLCEQGDLLSVPAGLKHWFDMGIRPFFKCIRLFTSPEGWVAQYTGDNIAQRFPSFDEYLKLYA